MGLKIEQLPGLRAVRVQFSTGEWADADGVRHAAHVSVWGRWVVWAAVLAEAAYRPELQGGTYVPFIVLHVVLLIYNGLVHRRLALGRKVIWPWVLGLSVIDFAIITASIVSNGGFYNFHYLFYYPALALFAVICPSFHLSLACTTAVAALYGVLCLTAGPGLELGAGDEVVLIARLTAMYAVFAAVNVTVRYERGRRSRAAERERALLQERVELSQIIHDTAAQSAYVLGLGIDTARMLAGQSNEELNETLEAASMLSKSIVWELRRPIDGGLIFEGTELGQALKAHSERFGSIASVSVEMVQLGDEPPLPVETRSRLFTVAHNALANALLHSRADRVWVTLDFRGDSILLSVSDNGVGLPGGHAEIGRGFAGMRTDADRMGGRLILGQAGPEGGTVVTCEVPRWPKSQGG